MESAIRRIASSFSVWVSRIFVDNGGRSSGMASVGGSTATRGEDSGDGDVVEEIGSIIGSMIGDDNPEELATKLARKKMKKANRDLSC